MSRIYFFIFGISIVIFIDLPPIGVRAILGTN